ncbi:MAG TPA: formate dehydrogenase accessory sulfurtransferase FdhD [Planctomycetota bacterium]|nr:formate dehydrogenase accessory sulfurtransferase FdhD [Planctomycetota bacterium]
MTLPKVAKHETRKISIKRAAAPSTAHQAQHVSFEDHLAVEEPLEIRIHDEPVVITMRTPGEDFALAAGFLYSEGLLHGPKDVGSIRYCDNTQDPHHKNIVNFTFASGHKPDLARLKRNFYATSSCGVCGKASIDQIKMQAKPITSKIKIRLDVVYSMGHSLRKAQTLFEKTGGLHAAGVFDEHGTLHTLHEDVGRHNAVDKVIGHMLLQDRAPLDHHLLMVSGRASFEIMQKAVMARMPIVCAVSAPSSLAVETAREFGVTLVGFLREDDFNVYTHAERIEV